MISASNLEKTFGGRTLFADATFQLNPGERYGLVGANGSGKSTLLNILAGRLEATDGTVAIPKRLRLGVLRQDHFMFEDQEILGVALMGNPELWNAMVEKEALLANAEHEFDADRFSELEEIVQLHDGYSAEARASTILEGLGLPTAVHRQPLSTLSGGFKLRVLLAQVLASAPDILLLDEPTNHLDILSIRWLEKFMKDFAGPLVVISHDHRFLDAVSTHILDVDYATVTMYTGNYSDFVAAKVAERERREKDIASRGKEIEHHQKFIDRFKAKASKARQAQSKLRLVEKKAASLEALAPSSRRYPAFRFEPRRASGREVLKVDGISKAFGDKQVLNDVSLVIERGDRVAILGPNGIGKSTLLKIIMGELEPDAGEVTWGYETHPGYFAQDHHEQFEKPRITAQQWVWDLCPGKDIGYVRGRMGLLLFSGDDGKKRLESLSGGEAARLVFCGLSIGRPNVLVLDEPTNHLDLESIEALVEALQKFEGTVLLVSHDRWFVDQVAERIVEIKPDEIIDYRGSYQEYVHACGDDHLDADAVVLKARASKSSAKTKSDSKAETAPQEAGGTKTKSGSSKSTSGGSKSKSGGSKSKSGGAKQSPYTLARERKRLVAERDGVTSKIERTEQRVGEIDQVFADPSYYSSAPKEDIRALEEERAGLSRDVEGLMAEWERIEGELGQLEG